MTLAVVTGATGFIGRHLVHRLLLDGVPVRVLVRERGARRAGTARLGAPLDRSGVQLAWGDVTDPVAVARALEGADTVYHLAGYALAWARNERVFHDANVRGTENVCRAAREHGVRRLVHISTELVAGDPDDPRLQLTAYQRTKLEGDRAVTAYFDADGAGVIVRPTRVFGPGVVSQSNSVTRLIDLYRRGLFRLRIADGGARANYVHVDDVIDGTLLAAGGETNGADYTLGGENATLPQFLSAIGAATGTERTVLSVPQGLALSVAAVAEALGYVGIHPFITRDWAELLCIDRPASSDRAREELGYRPRGLAEGVRDTVRWLRAGCPSPFAAPSTETHSEWQSA